MNVFVLKNILELRIFNKNKSKKLLSPLTRAWVETVSRQSYIITHSIVLYQFNMEVSEPK